MFRKIASALYFLVTLPFTVTAAVTTLPYEALRMFYPTEAERAIQNIPGVTKLERAAIRAWYMSAHPDDPFLVLHWNALRVAALTNTPGMTHKPVLYCEFVALTPVEGVSLEFMLTYIEESLPSVPVLFTHFFHHVLLFALP